MTEKQPVAVVPRAVYDFVERIREEQPDQMSSISGMVKLAKGDKEKEAARWIKLNPVAYGVGYWNGFVPDDNVVEQDESDTAQPAEEQPARKRRRIPPKEADNG